MKRFTITAIKKDGLRHIAFANNHLSHFDKKEDAEKHLADVLSNNNPDTISDLVGTDLTVSEIECYPTGDAMRTIMPS